MKVTDGKEALRAQDAVVPPREAAAPPDSRQLGVLIVHTLAIVLIQSVSMSVLFILPIIARKRFAAGDWQTAMVTAAPTILFICSIFWHALLQRTTVAKYLLAYWSVGLFALAFAAFAQNFWQLLAFHVIGSIGGAGWSPIHGETLQRMYRGARHGRALGVLQASMLLGGMVGSYSVGQWLESNQDAFRVYMPVAALLQLIGVCVLIGLWRASGAAADRRRHTVNEPVNWADLVRPVLHMRQVLRADNIFYRYEAAFMTYGIGWMICFALLPLIATDKLHLNYADYSKSTQFVYLLGMLVTTYPAGRVLDHIGASRTSSLSFALLVLYPLGLLLAPSAGYLAVVGVVYGVAMAGVNMGWMLGPVSLAPSPDKVPQYVAIHTTLVGLRGTLFQGLGVFIYTQTHSFVLPLIIAAGAFVWAATQMWRLHGRIRSGRQALSSAEKTLEPV